MKLHFALLVKIIDAFRGGSVSAVPFRRGQFLVKTRQINQLGECGENQVDAVGDLCIEEKMKTFYQVSYIILLKSRIKSNNLPFQRFFFILLLKSFKLR